MKDLELETKEVLRRHFERLWDYEEEFAGKFLYGDDTLALMAEAAASVLLATQDMREYLRREKIKP